MRVLVVEARREERLIVKRTLKNGFFVITLSSPSEARAFSRCHHYEVAIISVNESRLWEGVATLHDLQSVSKSAFKAIALNVGADDVLQDNILNAGFSAVISRPFTQRAFLQAIQNDVPVI